jgi:tetratricopeptide (TPR) repeat protein
MPAVLATGIACGVSAISLACPPRRVLARSARGLVAAALAVLAVGALGVQIANTAQANAYVALHQGRFPAAEANARRALRFAPWTSEPLRVRGEAELAQRRYAAAGEEFGSAIQKDPQDWHLWFDLAAVSSGRERATALKRALRLDPLEPALLDFAGALKSPGAGRSIEP